MTHQRPSRSAAFSIALATLACLLAGCAREAPDVQAVRKASERYLRALGRKEVEVLRTTSTCVVSMNTVAGGKVLAIGRPQPMRLHTLDSLLYVTEAEQRRADSLWASATDASADSLYQRRRRLGLRYVVYRNAQRAAQASLPESLVTGTTWLELRRVLVRVRYAGALIGPRPVDREEVLRLLRSGSGNWIVYSLYLTQDDPIPPPR